MKYVYQLCAGRHPAPGNPPAIYKHDVNPLDTDVLYTQADVLIPDDATALKVYVTGLTVAMLAVVSVCYKRHIKLTCLHYDRDSGNYYQQDIM